MSMINAPLLKYMQQSTIDAVEIIDWQDATRSGGYCDTCWYEYAIVVVTYKDSNGETCKWEYDGSFSDLIYNLDRLT